MTIDLKVVRSNMMAGIIERHSPLLTRLYSRWLEEREHEDFLNYEKIMKEAVGEPFLRGTTYPFGFILDMKFPYKVQVFIDRKTIGWKPL